MSAEPFSPSCLHTIQTVDTTTHCRFYNVNIIHDFQVLQGRLETDVMMIMMMMIVD